MLAPYVAAPFVALGTDGFGRSDTRAALRAFFEVDAASVALAALDALARAGHFAPDRLAAARDELAPRPDAPDPWSV
jgi:pyruvate dehydrogenase E1 component